MNDSRRYIPVEAVLPIYCDRLWYYIPGFNGYEISNDGYVRSMKHYRAYPFGILIQPKKDKDGNIIDPEDPIFELSDNNNERHAIHRSQLIYLSKNNKLIVNGYPRSTIITDRSSRNDRHFVVRKGKGDQDLKLPNTNYNKDTTHYVKFTIVQDTKQAFNSTLTRSKLICPIKPLDPSKGENYYGRKDCRTIVNQDVRTGSNQVFYCGQ